jgi:hypothetical protein
VLLSLRCTIIWTRARSITRQRPEHAWAKPRELHDYKMLPADEEVIGLLIAADGEGASLRLLGDTTDDHAKSRRP